MKKKKAMVPAISESEFQLLEQLRAHPEMRERIESILAIARNTEGPLRSADEVEELLVQEMRQLGSTSMHEWARHAEQRVAQELKEQDLTVRSRKKKR